MEHRNCAQHVFVNWNGQKRAKTYEFAFWNIVHETTKRQWEDAFAELKKIDKEAICDLMDRNPKQWTRAFQGTTSKCDVVDNNMCEAFNSVLVDSRHKSVITMLEAIRVYMMKYIFEKKRFLLISGVITTVLR